MLFSLTNYKFFLREYKQVKFS